MSRNPRKIEDILALAPLQEGLLFHSVYDEGELDPYVVQASFDIDGQLDKTALRAAATALLARHSALRVAFRQRKNGDWAQIVLQEVPLPWTETDFTALPEADRAQAADAAMVADRTARFDVTRPPLLRFTLLRLGPDLHRLVLTNHHLVLDGWSLPILMGELFTLYENGGDTNSLPRARPYREYINWLAAQDREAARDAWRTAYADLTEPTPIAPEAGRTTVTSAAVQTTLSSADTRRLSELARSRGVTLNTVVQTAWGLVLAKHTGRDDIVFGTTVSGRPPEIEGVERMVGLFINTVPTRVRLRPAETLGDLLTRVQDEHTRLAPHQHLELAEIQRAIGQGELFDTSMVFQNYPVERADVAGDGLGAGVRLTPGKDREATHYPLMLVGSARDTMHFRLDYRPDVYDETSAQQILDRFVHIMHTLVTDAALPLGRLDVLTEPELERMLGEWGVGGGDGGVLGGSVLGLFGEQVLLRGGSVAV
ncbi:condensation domain-containing protein, partial [Streptomyces sp. HSW2009]|uniref:condensation domain-containing protein n=1 Tax=Streptomyces sp. HSW2009 TaxID=3142890 RepID=UPI0032EB8999